MSSVFQEVIQLVNADRRPFFRPRLHPLLSSFSDPKDIFSSSWLDISTDHHFLLFLRVASFYLAYFSDSFPFNSEVGRRFFLTERSAPHK